MFAGHLPFLRAMPSLQLLLLLLQVGNVPLHLTYCGDGVVETLANWYLRLLFREVLLLLLVHAAEFLLEYFFVHPSGLG